MGPDGGSSKADRVGADGARCFVAAEPGADLVRRLRPLVRPTPGVRWVPAEQWHITLRFFAAVDPRALLEALSVLRLDAPVTARSGPRPVAMAGRVWVVPVSGLDAVAEAVARATAHLGRPGPAVRSSRASAGDHLTLARARRRGGLPRDLPAPPVEAVWPVTEVLAYASELGSAGAVHTLLGRFPLAPR